MKRIFAVFTALLILCSGFYANAERNGSSSSKIGENISDFVSETIHGENINGAVFAQKKDNGSALFCNLECRMHKRDGIYADGGGRFLR